MSWLLSSLPIWSNALASGPSSSLLPEVNDDPDLDAPPLFPLPDSIQRSKSGPLPAPTFSLAPPSPPRESSPPSELNTAVLPDRIPLWSMAPPPSTTKRPAFGIQTSSSTSTLDTGGASVGTTTNGAGPSTAKSKKRSKVALAPGHSPLDWARLTSSGKDLRGTPVPIRVTVSELKLHNKLTDAWSAFNGKVYNITPYLPFHPGGEAELMRAAGRDGTKLFMLTHSWVNMEYMMQECLVGMLVRG